MRRSNSPHRNGAHSNLVPWQLLAERTGAKLVFVPVVNDEGVLDLARLDDLLTPKVKLFAMVHIPNSLGTVNPVAQLCALRPQAGSHHAGRCRAKRRAYAARRPRDGCDFLAFSGHKVCGPTGVGVLYGRGEILEGTPPYQGGSDMIDLVSFHKSTYKTAPHKFEAGTPGISGAVGLHAALNYLDAIGRRKIWEHDRQLGEYAYAELSALKNIRIFGPKTGRAGVVSFLLNGIHAHDIVTVGDQRGVALCGGHHCTQPLQRKLGVDSTARASFYFYNTKEEINRLIEVTREIQRFFGT